MAVPSYETIDHFGITVPDLDQAIGFFVEVLGAELWYREGPFEDPEGETMWDEMRIPSRAVERLAMLRMGSTATVELLEFAVGGETDRAATDVSRHSVGHLGLRVHDIEAALEGLRGAEGVEVLAGPTRVEGGAADGLRWIYFLAPWGLPLELIELPPGMSV